MKEIKVLEGKVVAPEGMKVGIVASRFNEIIVNKLLGGAVDGLVRHGVEEDPELRPISTDSSCLSLKVSERQLRRSAPPGFLSLRSRSTTRRSRTHLRISDAKVWFSTVPQTPGRAPRS